MIFSVNRKRDFNSRKQSAIISLFVPGLGQLLSGRLYGIFFPLIIIPAILFLLYLKKPIIFQNGLIILGFLIFHIINIIDAFNGPFRKKSPCKLACPAGINVPAYIALIADRRFEEAKAIIRMRMPFISVCGSICDHPCETKCVRNGYDTPVMIMNLKKTVSDKIENVYNYKVKNTNKNAAIIGAGPGGLSLAYFLSKKSINVDIYEKENEPGGLLRYGIPRFRIDMLDILKDINEIVENEYVNLITNTNVGKDISFDEIRKNHNYTILALGNNDYHCPQSDITPEKNVYHGLEILKRVSNNEIINLGNRVAIIGGGNVAVDVARTIVRMGSSVVEVFYRGKMENMKANADEINESLEEGIILRTEMEIESIEDRGLLSIIFKNNDNEKIEDVFDSLIYATGQSLKMDSINKDLMIKKGFKSNVKNVYILKDAGTIVQTVNSARIISKHIILKCFNLNGIIYNIYDELDYFPEIREISDAAWNYDKPKHTDRVNLKTSDMDKRLNTFFKVNRDLTDNESVFQAKRCFRCNR